MSTPPTYTAFLHDRRIAAGALPEVLAQVTARDARTALVFEDATGDLVKLSTPAEIAAALAGPAPPAAQPNDLTVRLLPRHIAWLQAQPGGPAAAIRRLVDAARQDGAGQPRQARDAAYRFLSQMAGDRPGFEAATRALYAGDGAAFDAACADWPADLRVYGRQLAVNGLA